MRKMIHVILSIIAGISSVAYFIAPLVIVLLAGEKFNDSSEALWEVVDFYIR